MSLSLPNTTHTSHETLPWRQDSWGRQSAFPLRQTPTHVLGTIERFTLPSVLGSSSFPVFVCASPFGVTSIKTAPMPPVACIWLTSGLLVMSFPTNSKGSALRSVLGHQYRPESDAMNSKRSRQLG